MTDAGYTATEALAALAILGLAMAGLTSGMQVIGRAQSTTTATLSAAASVRSLATKLDQLWIQRGPFRSNDAELFRGDGRHFDLACGMGRCSADIVGAAVTISDVVGGAKTFQLEPYARPEFIYGGSDGVGGVWPPQPPPDPTKPAQSLQFVAVADVSSGQVTPLAVSRLWDEQAPNCDFDSVAQDCRKVAP